MTQMHQYPDNNKQILRSVLHSIAWIIGLCLVGFAALIGILLLKSPLGGVLGSSLNQLFAIDSVQLLWYITRAAGLTAYVLLWLSVVWGLAVSSKIFDSLLHRMFTYDYHQFISLLAIGFIILHIAVLMADRYLPYTLAQVLIPFLSPYRPLWVGIGVIAFYLTLLVTITFYIRSRIGSKAFRAIHVSSLLAYLGATVHGFYSGTDSSLLTTQIVYAGTFLAVVFLTVYWLIILAQKKANSQPPKEVPVKKAPQPLPQIQRRSSQKNTW
jgi:sulfoxide reductase heme-binding subunit YedZ